MIPEAQRLPCRRCGAPLDLVESAPSLPVVTRCAWCGEEEVLPAEPAERARALQILRAQRAWADAATRGTSASLVPLATFGGALRLVGPTVAFGVLTSALSIVVFDALPAGVLPLMGAFVGLALAAPFVAQRARRTLGPLLAALPPREPSAPARCRQCGAPLSFRGASARCAACAATNLAPAVVASQLADPSDLAARHREGARRRVLVEKLGAEVGLTWTVGLVLGGALGGLLQAAIG